MAGHSKWKNTKHRKIVQDMKRGKIFNKLIREVRIAAKLGGSDVVYNPRLRVVLEKALSKNMAKGTLDRVIFHQSNKVDNGIMENVLYEGYGPGGTAFLLQCLTNNKNRIVSEVRHVLSKFGGNLGTDGSVSYLFDKKGVISCCSYFSEDIVINAALKIGADDISVHPSGIIKIYVELNLLSGMEVELKSTNVKIYESNIFMLPYSYVNLNSDDSLKFSKLIERLKNIDDVYEICHNGKFFKG